MGSPISDRTVTYDLVMLAVSNVPPLYRPDQDAPHRYPRLLRLSVVARGIDR